MTIAGATADCGCLQVQFSACAACQRAGPGREIGAVEDAAIPTSGRRGSGSAGSAGPQSRKDSTHTATTPSTGPSSSSSSCRG
eukprot:31001-Heterocapsa_arctica.AAC.1